MSELAVAAFNEEEEITQKSYGQAHEESDKALEIVLNKIQKGEEIADEDMINLLLWNGIIEVCIQYDKK